MSLLTLALFPEQFVPPAGSLRVIRCIDPFDAEPEPAVDEERSIRPNRRALVEYALQSGCTSIKAMMLKTRLSKGGVRANLRLILQDNLVAVKPRCGNIPAVYTWIGET